MRWDYRRFFSTSFGPHPPGARCSARHGHPPELIDVLVGELFIMFFQTDCGVVLAQTDCAAAYSYGLAAGELPAGARMPPNLKEQRI